MRLFLLHLRRGLHPGMGLTLLAIALFVRFGGEVPATVGLGASEPLAILRGLRRADLLLAMLAVLLPLATVQALRTWSTGEGRESLWLLSSPASKVRLVFATWAGSWCAGLLWLFFSLALCEGLAGGDGAPEWRAAGELAMEDVRREGEAGALRWSSPVEGSEEERRVHFKVGLFGSDADLDEFVLTSYEQDGTTVFDQQRTEPARISILDVAIPPGQDRVQFELGAEGATRSLLLNKPRLQLFLSTGSSVPTWLLLGRVALLLAVAQALALGISAWFSAGTSLGYVFSLYALVWLEEDRWNGTLLRSWLPGDDLPGALDWIAQGRGPGQIPVEAWAGTLLLVILGLGSLHLGLGRRRAGR